MLYPLLLLPMRSMYLMLNVPTHFNPERQFYRVEMHGTETNIY